MKHGLASCVRAPSAERPHSLGLAATGPEMQGQSPGRCTPLQRFSVFKAPNDSDLPAGPNQSVAVPNKATCASTGSG